MKIHWHELAYTALYEVEDYIFNRFGEKTRQEFMYDVDQAVLALTKMPEMGIIDPLFEHRHETYRSIIVRRLNKIIYYVKDDTLHIAGFWDARRDSKTQAKLVEAEKN